MGIKEVLDFHEINLDGLDEKIHIIYEKVCHMEPKLNEQNLIVGTIICETYEEISVYEEEEESLFKKANFRIDKDVNSTVEALNIITHIFASRISA